MVVLLAADLVASLDMMKGGFNGVVCRLQRRGGTNETVVVEFAYICLDMLGQRVATRFLTSYVILSTPTLELPHEPNTTFPLFIQEHVHSTRVD